MPFANPLGYFMGQTPTAQSEIDRILAELEQNGERVMLRDRMSAAPEMGMAPSRSGLIGRGMVEPSVAPGGAPSSPMGLAADAVMRLMQGQGAGGPVVQDIDDLIAEQMMRRRFLSEQFNPALPADQRPPIPGPRGNALNSPAPPPPAPGQQMGPPYPPPPTYGQLAQPPAASAQPASRWGMAFDRLFGDRLFGQAPMMFMRGPVAASMSAAASQPAAQPAAGGAFVGPTIPPPIPGTDGFANPAVAAQAPFATPGAAPPSGWWNGVPQAEANRAYRRLSGETDAMMAELSREQLPRFHTWAWNNLLMDSNQMSPGQLAAAMGGYNQQVNQANDNYQAALGRVLANRRLGNDEESTQGQLDLGRGRLGVDQAQESRLGRESLFRMSPEGQASATLALGLSRDLAGQYSPEQMIQMFRRLTPNGQLTESNIPVRDLLRQIAMQQTGDQRNPMARRPIGNVVEMAQLQLGDRFRNNLPELLEFLMENYAAAGQGAENPSLNDFLGDTGPGAFWRAFGSQPNSRQRSSAALRSAIQSVLGEPNWVGPLTPEIVQRIRQRIGQPPINPSR